MEIGLQIRIPRVNKLKILHNLLIPNPKIVKTVKTAKIVKTVKTVKTVEIQT